MEKCFGLVICFVTNILYMSFKINIFVKGNPSSSTVSGDLMVFPSKDMFFNVFVLWKNHKSKL